MGKVNSKEKLINAVISDLNFQAKDIVSKEKGFINAFINHTEDHTALTICAYYGSNKSAKSLLEVGIW